MLTAKSVIWVFGVLALTLHAEDNGKRSWDNLTALRQGQQVQVKSKASESWNGTFLGFTPDSISIHARSRDVEIQRANVKTVKRNSTAARIRHTLIGAGIGAAAGAAIAVPNINEGYAAYGAAAAAVITFVGSTVVGALLPAHSTVYEAGP